VEARIARVDLAEQLGSHAQSLATQLARLAIELGVELWDLERAGAAQHLERTQHVARGETEGLEGLGGLVAATGELAGPEGGIEGAQRELERLGVMAGAQEQLGGALLLAGARQGKAEVFQCFRAGAASHTLRVAVSVGPCNDAFGARAAAVPLSPDAQLW
jgi:hypothetical protein